MSDRRNRVFLTIVGFLLLVGGSLSVCLAAGVFGTARSDQKIFDSTVIRWWDEGGWKSFAVVSAIGAVAVVLGVFLAFSELRRNDGRRQTPTVTFPAAVGARGETSLRSPAFSSSSRSRPRSHP